MRYLKILVFLATFAAVVIPCYLIGAIASVIVASVMKGWNDFDNLEAE